MTDKRPRVQSWSSRWDMYRTYQRLGSKDRCPRAFFCCRQLAKLRIVQGIHPEAASSDTKRQRFANLVVNNWLYVQGP